MHVARLAAWSLGSIAAPVACLSPTQITARLSTDVDCSTVQQNGASIYGTESKSEAPITSTRTCADTGTMHDIGSLVITPSGDNEEALSVVVVAGVKRASEECAANAYKGCIVARRRMRFVAHEPLDLPIDLLSQCLDVPCDEQQTCFRGSCIDAEVSARDGCLGPDCPAARAAVTTSSTWTLVQSRPAGEQIRGLALDGTTLWFSVWLGSHSQLYAWAMGVDPAPRLQLDTPDVIYGIAVKDNDQVRAGSFGNGVLSGIACAYLQHGTQLIARTCNTGSPPSIGVAMLPGPSPSFWVTLATAAHRFDAVNDVALDVGGGGYAEGDAAGVWFVAGTNITGSQWTGPPGITIAKQLPRAGRGFAMSTGHWFVSTTDGEVYVVNRLSAKQSSLAPAGSLASVEDILFDERSGRLYAAGVLGNVPGIYRIDVPSNVLPP